MLQSIFRDLLHPVLWMMWENYKARKVLRALFAFLAIFLLFTRNNRAKIEFPIFLGAKIGVPEYNW